MSVHTVVDSPVDPITLVAQDDVLTGVYLLEHRHPDPSAWGPGVALADAPEVLRTAARQLGEYFAGSRREFTLPVRAAGSEFQRAVWTVLETVPYGATTTYGQVGARVGLRPGGARAVGLAVGRNPLSLVIPCHRVLGAGGTMTGYAGGVARKQALLALERPLATLQG